jgi:DNA-directed RNA polymerase specialized sigma24 family protein
MEFQNAYATGFPRTVRFIRSKGINPSDAEEIAQAAWVKGWERRQQLKCAESLSSWVNSIAFNVLRNFARKSKRSTEFQACHDRGVAPAAVPARLDLDRVTSGCSPLDRRLLWASRCREPGDGNEPADSQRHCGSACAIACGQ